MASWLARVILQVASSPAQRLAQFNGKKQNSVAGIVRSQHAIPLHLHSFFRGFLSV